MKLVPLLLAAIALPLVARAQTVIYRETFGNNHGADTYLSNINTDWEAYRFVSGTLTNVTALDTGQGRIVSYNGGSPTNLPNVNTGETTLSQSNGFIFINAGTGALIKTNGYTIDRDAFSAISFTWTERDSPTDGGLRLAIQIGENWYASDALYKNESSSWALQTFNFTTAASAWRALTFTDTALSLSDTTLVSALPSGDIIGFGLYVFGTTANVRFDTFTVNATAIPEPSTLAITSLGFAFCALRRRRSRR